HIILSREVQRLIERSGLRFELELVDAGGSRWQDQPALPGDAGVAQDGTAVTVAAAPIDAAGDVSIECDASASDWHHTGAGGDEGIVELPGFDRSARGGCFPRDDPHTRRVGVYGRKQQIDSLFERGLESQRGRGVGQERGWLSEGRRANADTKAERCKRRGVAHRISVMSCHNPRKPKTPLSNARQGGHRDTCSSMYGSTESMRTAHTNALAVSSTVSTTPTVNTPSPAWAPAASVSAVGGVMGEVCSTVSAMPDPYSHIRKLIAV